MSELELFPSDDESFITEVSPSQTADTATFSSPAANNNIEPPSSNRGRQPSRSSPHTPRRRRLPSPPPARNSSSSSSSSSMPSHLSVHPNIPPIGKWTVKGLRQALINSDANFSSRMKKAELFNLCHLTIFSPFCFSSNPIGSNEQGPPGPDRSSRSVYTLWLTYGAFPLHGTVRYGSLRLALNGTTSFEVPSVPYRY
ncbi:hypothetical protein PO909_008375 [Leuciscus waleckii]